MKIPPFTEAAIRQQTTPESFVRGGSYYSDGAVLSLVLRGNVVAAEVVGSQYEPYRVQITFDEAGVTSATCNCPYDWNGWCKHIVAALLACLHEPDQIEERPALGELLACLDREQLQDILSHLANDAPHIADKIEAQIVMNQPNSDVHDTNNSIKNASQRRLSVDPNLIRRRVRDSLHSLDRMRRSEAYWHVGNVVDQVRQVLYQAQDFIHAGEGRHALMFLEAITDEYVKGWTCLDDSDGYASGFFSELGEVWTEAGLSADDLTSDERAQWAETLTRWQTEVDDYGIDDAFDAAQASILQGWDSVPLQRAMRGETNPMGAWEGEAPWYADELAVTRLQVLDRQGRHEEYLHLAKAEGQVGHYVLMLARLGRVQEAENDGLQLLNTPTQFLELAKALREQQALDAALRVAECGLAADGHHKGRLAIWLCNLAEGMGKMESARKAATVAFYEIPGMDTYQRVQALEKERWPETREDLLNHLRNPANYANRQATVDIFLHEGLLDDAINAVDKSANYDLIGQVVDAVVEYRPEWVIGIARLQAERIIETGQSMYYHHAVGWLTRVRLAYQAADRESDWQEYLNNIRVHHKRKYKLKAMLNEFK